MKIKFFIGFLSLFSICLIQECRAGSGPSKTANNGGEEDKRTSTTTSNPSVTPTQSTGFFDFIFGPSTNPVAPVSSQPSNSPPTHAEERQQTSSIATSTKQEENPSRALVQYKTHDFFNHKVPVPLSATMYNEEGNIVIYKQDLCDVIMIPRDKVSGNETVNKIISNHMKADSLGRLNQYLKRYYADLDEIGKERGATEKAGEATECLKALVNDLKLESIFATAKFQRNELSYSSRLMIELPDGNVILTIVGLPTGSWKQPKKKEDTKK